MSVASLDGFDGFPVPVGTVLYSASGIIPNTYLLCDGSQLNKNQYTELFYHLGFSFGVGDSPDYFKLPDMVTSSPYLRGAAVTNPNLINSSFNVVPFLLEIQTIPSLPSSDFTTPIWNGLEVDVNGPTPNVYYTATTHSLQVDGTGQSVPKGDSSVANSFSGTLTAGTIGFNNPAQTLIAPTTVTSIVTYNGYTMVPIVKAWYGRVAPTYDPSYVTPPYQTFGSPFGSTFFPQHDYLSQSY